MAPDGFELADSGMVACKLNHLSYQAICDIISVFERSLTVLTSLDFFRTILNQTTLLSSQHGGRRGAKSSWTASYCKSSWRSQVLLSWNANLIEFAFFLRRLFFFKALSFLVAGQTLLTYGHFQFKIQTNLFRMPNQFNFWPLFPRLQVPWNPQLLGPFPLNLTEPVFSGISQHPVLALSHWMRVWLAMLNLCLNLSRSAHWSILTESAPRA